MSGVELIRPAPDGLDEGDGSAGGRDGERGGREGAYESTTIPAYDADRNRDRHHPSHGRLGRERTGFADRAVVVLVAVVAAAIWSGSITIGIVVALAATPLAGRGSTERWTFVVVALMLVSLGALRAEHSWNGLAPDDVGPFAGWVRVVDDPATYRIEHARRLRDPR